MWEYFIHHIWILNSDITILILNLYPLTKLIFKYEIYQLIGELQHTCCIYILTHAISSLWSKVLFHICCAVGLIIA